MGFGQKGQTGHALGFEAMGDQVEQGGASTSGCGGDGVSEESFVVESGAVAVVELENAVLPHRIGGVGGGAGRGLAPSRVGMETGETLVHQVFTNLHTLRAESDSHPAAAPVTHLDQASPCRISTTWELSCQPPPKASRWVALTRH